MERVSHHLFSGSDAQIKAINDQGSHIAATWGEIRSAFLVPRMFQMNGTIQAIGRILVPEKRIDSILSKEILHREIDLVWVTRPHQNRRKSVWAWGEVKTLRRPFDINGSFHYIQDSLTASIRDQRIAAKATGMNIQLHALFINGLTERSRNWLYQLGYDNVHGKIVEPASHGEVKRPSP